MAADGAVDELVGDDEGAGRELLLERTAGRDGQHVGDAGLLQRADVGAVVDALGREAVAAAVARQEHRLGATDATEVQRVRRLAERRGDALLAQILQARQVVDARPPDDPDDGFSHEVPLATPLLRRFCRISRGKAKPGVARSRVHILPARYGEDSSAGGERPLRLVGRPHRSPAQLGDEGGVCRRLLRREIRRQRHRAGAAHGR